VDEEGQQIFNNGFDNDQGDYMFEINDQINYRYEILKRLGKGAFGIVL
jgi:dual specificity tyrosine-phosphorylation-regulated kinase 2/3/4